MAESILTSPLSQQKTARSGDLWPTREESQRKGPRTWGSPLKGTATSTVVARHCNCRCHEEWPVGSCQDFEAKPKDENAANQRIVIMKLEVSNFLRKFMGIPNIRGSLPEGFARHWIHRCPRAARRRGFRRQIQKYERLTCLRLSDLRCGLVAAGAQPWPRSNAIQMELDSISLISPPACAALKGSDMQCQEHTSRIASATSVILCIVAFLFFFASRGFSFLNLVRGT